MISNEYSEKTRRSMAMLSEKEHSFECIEVIFYLLNIFSIVNSCTVRAIDIHILYCNNFLKNSQLLISFFTTTIAI